MFITRRLIKPNVDLTLDMDASESEASDLYDPDDDDYLPPGQECKVSRKRPTRALLVKCRRRCFNSVLRNRRRRLHSTKYNAVRAFRARRHLMRRRYRNKLLRPQLRPSQTWIRQKHKHVLTLNKY